MSEQKQILQHIPVEERPFAETVIDLCLQVEDTFSYRLTRFLNPKQDEIVRAIGAYYQLQVFSTREWMKTEFSRCIIAPSYYQLDKEDFDMVLFEVKYPSKFHQLSHSQLLGTLLNRLGMKREFLGDIILSGEQRFVLIDRKFGQLIQQEIQKVGPVPVKWEEIEDTSIASVEQSDYESKQVLLSSLRLDKAVAAIFSLSRAAASKLIEAGQVKVDYSLSQQVSKKLEPGQLVSVRGFGRFRLKEIVGYSKQGKIKIEIERIKK